MKRFLACGLLMVFTALLCSCFDSREFDQSAYLIALGIDRGNETKFTYTFQIASPVAASGSESPGNEEGSKNSGTVNITVDSDDFYTAKSLINSGMNKTVDMSHLKLIVFSSEVENQDFLSHSQLFLHERQVRPHTSVAVATEGAGQYLKSVKPTLEPNTAKYYELAAQGSNNIYYPTKIISDFVDQLDGVSRASALPIAHISGEHSKNKATPSPSMWVSADNSQAEMESSCLFETAVFKNGNLAGILGNDYTMIYNMLSRNIKAFTVSLKNPHDPNSALVFRITVPKSAKYKVQKDAKSCSITISQALDAQFIGGYLPKGFDDFEGLYSFAENVLFQKTNDFFYHISRDLGADIMNIGSNFDATLSKPLSHDGWDKLYTTADFNINLKLRYIKEKPFK